MTLMRFNNGNVEFIEMNISSFSNNLDISKKELNKLINLLKSKYDKM